MKYVLILILIGAVMLTACTSSNPAICTEDAKLCDDGTSVGRNPDNNCEFFECSNETPIPVEPDGGIGTTPEKVYVSESSEQCMVLNFRCEDGKQPFFDDKGCGCEPTLDEGKLQAYDCTDPRPQACTKEYMPVCGQVQVQCVTQPCDIQKQTFGNKCEACANNLTISYTQGACEEDNLAGGTVPAGTQEEQCKNIGGTWTGFDCTGIDANQCQEIGGKFNECASACRNDPDAQVCTMQCVQVCEFN
ncbi:MAG: hypothetical protein ACP5NV_04140 [Candidatus Woesearchaeota archaeon]